MLSSKPYRTLALSLLLSAGALSLPPAEAAPGRSNPLHSGPVVQMDLSTRSFIETMKNLWRLLKDAPAPPPPPDPQHREGTGMDPIGHPHG